MAYDCKVYDKNGNLKKVFSGNDKYSGVTKNFLNQKSTKRALSHIKTTMDPKIKTSPNTKFYKQQNQLRKKIRAINSGEKQ